MKNKDLSYSETGRIIGEMLDCQKPIPKKIIEETKKIKMEKIYE